MLAFSVGDGVLSLCWCSQLVLVFSVGVGVLVSDGVLSGCWHAQSVPVFPVGAMVLRPCVAPLRVKFGDGCLSPTGNLREGPLPAPLRTTTPVPHSH